MDRRTHAQVFRAIRTLLDVTSTIYFSDAQLAEVFNSVYLDWLNEAAPNAELAEKNKRQLGPLYQKKTLTLLTGTLTYSDVLPPPFRVLAVVADYGGCVGKRGAGPLSYDAWQTALRDPWNAPTDRQPKYLDGGTDLTILPRPVAMSLIYLVSPAGIQVTDDGALSAPGQFTEVQYEVQTRLIERTAAKLAIPQENGSVYQALTQEYAKNEQ